MQAYLIIKSVALILLLFIAYPIDSKAQNTKLAAPTATVKSWRSEETRITEKSLAIRLGPDLVEYEIDIPNLTQDKIFRLQLSRAFISTPRQQSIPCWEFTLKEIVADSNGIGKIPSYDLLSPNGPDFGAKSLAASICPVEKPKRFFDGNLHAIKAKREFLIDRFMFSVEVTDFIFDKKKNHLDRLDATLTFRNQ